LRRKMCRRKQFTRGRLIKFATMVPRFGYDYDDSTYVTADEQG
jgi:hypothetical protein